MNRRTDRSGGKNRKWMRAHNPYVSIVRKTNRLDVIGVGGQNQLLFEWEKNGPCWDQLEKRNTSRRGAGEGGQVGAYEGYGEN